MVNRREFIATLAGLTAGVMLPFPIYTAAGDGDSDRLGPLLPRRKLGRTGEAVTMLGVGGYHIGGSMDEQEAQSTIEAALEGGVRFFDTAESYQKGESERRYGKYLVPKYRADVFIMTKSTAKDAATARAYLEGSLKRLNTDYLDLWQVHSLQSLEDVDNRIAGGVLEVVQEAKATGKARHVGFTSHSNPYALNRMLEKADFFETVQMPINVVDAASEHSFINEVIPNAVKCNVGILAMKTLADGRFFTSKSRVKWRTDDPVVPGRVSLTEALYFAWSLPISVLITGPDHADMLREKIYLARKFVRLSEKERESLASKVADLAAEGRVEYYKKV